MASPRTGPSTAAAYFLSLLRMVAGLLFFCQGVQKLFGVWGGHKVALVTFLGGGSLLEFFGGLLMIFGLFTRVTALVLCAAMAAAYFMVHAKNGWVPIQNGGELVVLYCGLFLYFAIAGGGALSVDALVRKKG